MYETPDVPESEPADYYEEPENECIERLHISTKDAHNKFRGKYLSGYVDFSDRISNRFRSGYSVEMYEYGVDGGDKEKPIQKCRRLQIEMDELFQEINELNTDQAVSKEDKQCYENISAVVGNAKKILNGLRLEKVIGAEATSATGNAEMKQLLTQIENFKKSGGNEPVAAARSTSELAASKRIAELEHKLHEIEGIVGTEPEKLKRLSLALQSNNLLDAVQKISTTAALLQPSQLDLIENRLSTLATKMDTIKANPNSGTSDTSVDQKILELYEIARRTEAISPILPNMLQRMQALENLHSYGLYSMSSRWMAYTALRRRLIISRFSGFSLTATNFSKIIAELEATQQSLLTNIAGNRVLLQNVQEAFATNLESVKAEVSKLEGRVNKLPK